VPASEIEIIDFTGLPRAKRRRSVANSPRAIIDLTTSDF